MRPPSSPPNLHQPYLDEAILGYRLQLPYSIGIDVAGIHRVYKDMYARIDINGFYPSGPNQPFGGFGKVDPARGIVYPAGQQQLEPSELHRASS